METLHIHNELELLLIVEKALSLLKERSVESKASVLALSGTLGAGKTAFTKKLGEILGVQEVVTSPTFVVMKQYDTNTKELFDFLVHIDAYRIEDEDEMRVLRFGELLQTPRTLICIEWAERIQTLLPKDAVTLTLAVDCENEEARICTFS